MTSPVSTPETGVDSVSVSYAMLDPFMAIVGPIAAVASAIVTILAGCTEFFGAVVGDDRRKQHPVIGLFFPASG